jgi:hypothetical protein
MRTFNRRSTAALAVVAIGLTVAACGVSGTPTTSQGAAASVAASPSVGSSAAASSEGDPTGLCAMVPIDQVALALGMQTDGGVDDESILTGGLTCRFTGDADHLLDVELSELAHDQWVDVIETVGLNDEAVEGVGEEAYRAAGTALGGPGARFTAWADGIDVGVTVYSDVDQAVSFAAAQAIVEDLLAQTGN